jgi:hypothetical protein
MKEVQFEGEDNKSAIIFYFEEKAGRQMLGHNGGEEGIATDAYWNPETKVGFVIFANEGWDDDGAMEDHFLAMEEEILTAFEPTECVKGLSRGVPGDEEEDQEGDEEDYSDSECSGYDEGEEEEDGEGDEFSEAEDDEENPKWHRPKHKGVHKALPEKVKATVATRRTARKENAKKDRESKGGSWRGVTRSKKIKR